MYRLIAIATLLSSPLLVNAQGFQDLIRGTLGFANNVLIPFLLGIGFLFFLINAIRYFVLGSAEEQGREKAKNLAIYSVMAFVLIVIFWGIINMIASSIGLAGTAQPVTDYEDPDSVRTTGIPQSQATGNDSANPPSNDTNNPSLSSESTQNNENTNGWFSVPEKPQPDEPEEPAEAESDSSLGAWFERLFDIENRPFRDYFWANWNNDRNSSDTSGGNGNWDNNDDTDTTLINCLLPNGEVERLSSSDCDQAGGIPYNDTLSNSYELIECEFVNPNTSQRQSISSTRQNCIDYGGQVK